jgi:hypothetical protein
LELYADWFSDVPHDEKETLDIDIAKVKPVGEPGYFVAS